MVNTHVQDKHVVISYKDMRFKLSLQEFAKRFGVLPVDDGQAREAVLDTVGQFERRTRYRA